MMNEGKVSATLSDAQKLKRIRLLKKMYSNAIAITTNQIDIHIGSRRMNSFIFLYKPHNAFKGNKPRSLSRIL